MIHLDVAVNAVPLRLLQYPELQLGLVVDEVGDIVVVTAPGVRNLLRLGGVHEGMLANVVAVKDVV